MSKPAPNRDELNEKFLVLKEKNDIGLSSEMLAVFNENDLDEFMDCFSPLIKDGGHYLSDILKQNFLNFLCEELDRSKGESSTDKPKFNWDKIAKNLFGLAKKFAVGHNRIKDLKLAKELFDLTQEIKDKGKVKLPENFESEYKIFNKLFEFEKDELALLFFLPNEKVLKEKVSDQRYIDFIKEGSRQESFFDEYLYLKSLVYEVLERKISYEDFILKTTSEAFVSHGHVSIHEVNAYSYFALMQTRKIDIIETLYEVSRTHPEEELKLFQGRAEDPSQKKDISNMLLVAEPPLSQGFDKKFNKEHSKKAFTKASNFATKAYEAALSEGASEEALEVINNLVGEIAGVLHGAMSKTSAKSKPSSSTKTSTKTSRKAEGAEREEGLFGSKAQGNVTEATPLLSKEMREKSRLAF